LLHQAARFGIVTGSVAVDMAKVRQRKREMVEGLIALHLDLYQKSGAELAQAYRRFGSRVTVVEHGPQLAGREDPDVADAIGRLFGDEGIEVLLSA
jgi:pyruvate/2-oxoglutarate dehydrogenase complex dihydrolipoamide dehydrogenase (E3) component